MDTLDSRSLSHIDCFAQKFSTPGQVRYRITTGAGAHLALEGTIFTIKISRGAKGQAAGKQHDVTVRREGRDFSADPPRLEIEVGDIVLWHAPDAATPGFTVRGEGTNIKIDSSALTAEAIYTHAFGMPGYYEWVDANGGALAGIVEVRSLDTTKRMDGEKWLKALKKGALITINGQKATPDRIQILTGQTVVWAVKKAPGISITDARLVQRDKPSR